MEKSCVHTVSFVDEEGRTITSKVPVVQELVRRGVRQLPERFVRAQLLQDIPRPPPPSSSSSPDGDGLGSPPTIDMAKLRVEAEPGSRTEELGRLAGGVKAWGMVFVAGHGVAGDLMASLGDAVKGFFRLSLEEKKESVGSYADVDNLGYGRSFVKSDDQKLDWIDRLAMRVHPNQDSLGLRIWPRNPVNFRSVMENYVEAARGVCEQFLEALAEALTLERRSFTKKFEPSMECTVNVRVNYYPPCPIPDSVMGISPHTDNSVMTVLTQFDGTDGLEVLRNDRWTRVPAPPDALLVAAGDLLEIMSNGRLESPRHRAMTHCDKERFSVALFYYPPLRSEIEPVEDRGGQTKPVYRKVVVEDYLKYYYKVTPTDKKTVDIAKI